MDQTGAAIRDLRLRAGLKQGDLARRVGISASYFNQIERGRRRIGGKLLTGIASALGVAAADLTEGADSDLIDALRNVATDGCATPEAFAGRFPGWATRLAGLHARVRDLEASVVALTDRLAHDRELGDALHELLSAVTAIRSSASILESGEALDPNWRARFQRNIIEDSARLAEGAQALVDHLDRAVAGSSGVAGSPVEEVDAFFDRHAHHFPTLEAEGEAAIPTILDADPSLSDRARILARAHLEARATDARAASLARIESALAAFGVEPVAIAQDLGTDLATVLRRLAAMPVGVLPGAAGLAVCDASGAILMHRGTPGFALSRQGGLCALWPLFTAMAQPLRPIRRLLRQDGRDGRTVSTWSVAAPRAVPGPGDDLHLVSTMLILPVPEGEAKPQIVGETCATCALEGCTVRREPPRR